MSDSSQGSAAPQSAPSQGSSDPTVPSDVAQLEAQVNDSSSDGQEGDDSSSEVVADLKEQAATGTPKEKAQAKKMLKSLKIKFNGKEYEEALPFEIPDDDASREYMTRQLQMSRLAQEKSQSYSQLEKEVQNFVNELRKNPKKALSNPHIGIDIKQLAAEIIEEEIVNSQKSPEQLEKEQMQAELQALKEEREREKEETKTRELQRMEQQEYERYDMLMSQALEKSNLPKTPYVIKKMADYMLLGLQEGIDITPQDVLPLVEQEMQSDLKEMFSSMPDEVIQALVGKDVFNRVRKSSVAKAKAAPTALKAQVKDVAKASAPKEAEQKISYKDFFKV